MGETGDTSTRSIDAATQSKNQISCVAFPVERRSAAQRGPATQIVPITQSAGGSAEFRDGRAAAHARHDGWGEPKMSNAILKFAAPTIVLLVAPLALAMPVQIDFSSTPTLTPPAPGPGFRMDDSSPGVAPNFDNQLAIGSGLANNADNLDFLRISSSSSSTGGADVAGFIVVLPRMIVTDINSSGPSISYFGLHLDDGSGNPVMTMTNGFKVFAATDAGLTTPLLLADLTLVDPLLSIGESGLVEGTTGVVGLSNIHTLGLGSTFATLAEFAANGASGADFTARVNTAGIDIANNAMAGIMTEGSSNGSVQTVPEPTTMSLIGLGALLLVRHRARKSGRS